MTDTTYPEENLLQHENASPMAAKEILEEAIKRYKSANAQYEKAYQEEREARHTQLWAGQVFQRALTAARSVGVDVSQYE